MKVEQIDDPEDYYNLNKPRIKNVNDWIEILKNEMNQTGFDFIGKVLIPIYRRPNKYVFMKDLEAETGIKGINLRVGEFRDRIMKIVNIPVQFRENDGDDSKGRGWNIPFYTIKELNHNQHYSWCLRPELIEAMQILMPQLQEEKKSNNYEAVSIFNKEIEKKILLKFFLKIYHYLIRTQISLF